MHFLDLPIEVLHYITQFLPASSIVNLGKTCKHLLDVTDIDSIWQHLCYRDYQVESIDGWNLTHRDIYTKVLQKCGFLGWKRIGLLPYGGLVYVSWGKGEIQVLKYFPGASSGDNLQYHQIYSLQWNSSLEDVEVFCQQCKDGARPAVLTQGCRNRSGPPYPLIQCASETCHKMHTLSRNNQGYTHKMFKKGFEDHPDAFKTSFYKGYNCPMLPFPQWVADDKTRSPVQLGLYTGDYGSHGVEVLHLSFAADKPNDLIGLKVTGDPNVPAGYASITVHLDKPIMLTVAEQESIFDMLAADEVRDEESYAQLRGSGQGGGEVPDLRQPFAVPFDCFDRSTESYNTCMARYIAKGRIATTYYMNPSYCRCHFIKFSETLFGLLWLDLRSFSLFYLAKGLHVDFKS